MLHTSMTRSEEGRDGEHGYHHLWSVEEDTVACRLCQQYQELICIGYIEEKFLAINNSYMKSGIRFALS